MGWLDSVGFLDGIFVDSDNDGEGQKGGENKEWSHGGHVEGGFFKANIVGVLSGDFIFFFLFGDQLLFSGKFVDFSDVGRVSLVDI